MRAILCIGLLGLSLIHGARASRAADLDIEAELSVPNVKLLVVDNYASWCEPCIEAVPKWEALRRKYGRKGLRLAEASASLRDIEAGAGEAGGLGAHRCGKAERGGLGR